MNEAETRAELIDPKLKECGWGVTYGSKILREYAITAGRIQAHGTRAKGSIADYVLVYKGRKLAVIEAKGDELEVGAGVAHAKDYAEKLKLDYTYAANGREIYEICMKTGAEGLIGEFPTPEELWDKVFSSVNEWRDKFNGVPFEDIGGTKSARYYQEIAVNNAMAAIADEKERILLTLATGTGKTLLEKLGEVGYGPKELSTLQRLIDAEKSDLFDVLEYISFAIKPITREDRVSKAASSIFSGLDSKQKEFLEFVLTKYIETGVEELDQQKLPSLLELRYNSITDAVEYLGGVEKIQNTFIAFQKHLYENKVA